MGYVAENTTVFAYFVRLFVTLYHSTFKILTTAQIDEIVEVLLNVYTSEH
jgi:hypothetical protein